MSRLAAALAADPAALAVGAPPLAGRLAAELIARGSTALAPPACAVCGRTGRPLFRGTGGGVCQRCRNWQLAAACAICGKVKPVSGRDTAGQPVCEVCRRRGPARHRTCGNCGKTAPVAIRGRGGKPDICVNCYRLPAAACSVCGRIRPCTSRRHLPARLQAVRPAAHRGLRPLRPGPPAASPLAGRPGLRHLLHHRAAPPHPVRVLRTGTAAGQPARPGRRHLRQLRRAARHQRMR